MEGPWPKMGGNKLDRLIARPFKCLFHRSKGHFPDSITGSKTGLPIKQTLVAVPDGHHELASGKGPCSAASRCAKRFNLLHCCHTSRSLQTSQSPTRLRGQSRGSTTDVAGKSEAQHLRHLIFWPHLD